MTVMVTLIVLLAASPALGWDGDQAFKKGAAAITLEAGGGKQINIENHGFQSDLEFFNGGVRFSLLPLGPTGAGVLHGALELGLEPFYQQYVEPKGAFLAGLKAVGRYHFLSLGRFVPYFELVAGAGGTSLEVREINSTLTFILEGGIGASVFITDRTALTGGFRLHHISNGNTSRPNRGFEAATGIAGVSFFFP